MISVIEPASSLILSDAWHQPLFDFIRLHEAWLWWLGAASLLSMVVVALSLPFFICRLPEDYFTDEYDQRRAAERRAHTILSLLLLLARNILGALLVVAGIAMLFLPGQGVLTILIGVLLLTIPGKRPAVRWIACRRGVHRPLNWIRRKRGHAEFRDVPPTCMSSRIDHE